MPTPTPPSPTSGRDDGDSHLAELLKSDVTETWGRTARAAALILCWGYQSRRWSAAAWAGLLAAAGTAVAWLVR